MHFVSYPAKPVDGDSFWVCEKSDGIRVLLLIATNQATGDQSVYIVRPSFHDPTKL